jgi:hypothetical protein
VGDLAWSISWAARRAAKNGRALADFIARAVDVATVIRRCASRALRRPPFADWGRLPTAGRNDQNL